MRVRDARSRVAGEKRRPVDRGREPALARLSHERFGNALGPGVPERQAIDERLHVVLLAHRTGAAGRIAHRHARDEVKGGRPRLARQAKQLARAEDVDVTQGTVGTHPIDVRARVIDGIHTVGEPRVIAGRQAKPRDRKVSLDGIDAIRERRGP